MGFGLLGFGLMGFGLLGFGLLGFGLMGFGLMGAPRSSYADCIVKGYSPSNTTSEYTIP